MHSRRVGVVKRQALLKRPDVPFPPADPPTMIDRSGDDVLSDQAFCHNTVQRPGPTNELSLSSETDKSQPPLPEVDTTINELRTSAAALDIIPALQEVLDGCKTFISSYYQLGFIAKALFLERLSQEPKQSDLFLIYSLLSVTARFTPSLRSKYGGGRKATELFTERATAWSLKALHSPTIEHTQAFFLLGLAEWGSDDRNLSCMHMGIAVRMASILGLHREQTYGLPPNPTATDIIESEVARRTFWVLQGSYSTLCGFLLLLSSKKYDMKLTLSGAIGQESLHCDATVPAAFPLRDVSVLLPCEESDFAFGRLPKSRAALPGTFPALKNPALVSQPERSLFAALIQVQNLWGHVAQLTHPTVNTFDETTWSTNSHHSLLSDALREWEDGLDPRHRWSIWNLRGYKVEGLHWGYMSLVMILRLCNITLNRYYLRQIMTVLLNPGSPSDGSPPGYWENMSRKLFQDVFELDEQIAAFMRFRANDEAFPTELLFCIYTLIYISVLVCPDLAPQAEDVFHQAIDTLYRLRYDWPMAQRWENALRTASASKFGSNVISPQDIAKLGQEAASNPQAADASRPGSGWREQETFQLSPPASSSSQMQGTLSEPTLPGTSHNSDKGSFQLTERRPGEPNAGTITTDRDEGVPHNSGLRSPASFELDHLWSSFSYGDIQFRLPEELI
ncbi:conserved hypothetical protein [Paecilomyces variotii No. 5]|uniref:Xylanolytic transcriptional activator regulatory domain-containing protein n=1 Tax=Byssochlamys spectabilis (strain No. 5 / NBRC 109023) TaxID=1356009 RepID=V5G9C6_BYSSN|nr:conserved hypothetical protein [Paecilomyces variotii No. 5]